jgi:hypothetical protein
VKIRVLYPSAFTHIDPPPVGSDVIDLPEAEATAHVAAGYAEPVSPKVERATKAPGEKRDVARPKPEGVSE